MTALIAYRSRISATGTFDAYAGAGHNRYEVRIRDQWQEFGAEAPTFTAGMMLDGHRPSGPGLRVSLEGTAAQMTRRDGHHDLEVVARFQVGVSRRQLW